MNEALLQGSPKQNRSNIIHTHKIQITQNILPKALIARANCFLISFLCRNHHTTRLFSASCFKSIYHGRSTAAANGTAQAQTQQDGVFGWQQLQLLHGGSLKPSSATIMIISSVVYDCKLTLSNTPFVPIDVILFD